MPRIKSSIKDVRKNRKQRAINRTGRSKLKTAIRKARTATPDQQPSAVQAAYKVIDKSVQSGLIHRNAGARHKSRITRALNATTAAKTA